MVGALLVLTSLPSLCDAFSSRPKVKGIRPVRLDDRSAQPSAGNDQFIDSPQQRLLFKWRRRRRKTR